MTSAHLLTDAFDRIREAVHEAVEGLTPAQLAYRADPSANSIAWLVWHLTRVQDDHIADVAGTSQAWTDEGWADRFGLPLDPSETGYGHSPDQVEAVQVESAELLTGYHDAVHARTVAYVGALTDDDLPRVVDRAWNPPVTLGVRLVSVISDDLQHAGQAAFVRGLVLRV
ncbi:mycothiol transferase [Actinomadura chibensis]|uniref:DUF664 domain-containing protein n=1 Tax=Actinomadura chibensis TaxID=392828 RepID=A0A5D0NBP8_9ACTN|nr:DinB family protein [Actinomadura chibensis]TYB41731.1 DUF664 domain-containing protein [Actinomadura chibensis]